jgi:hypothetical protein
MRKLAALLVCLSAISVLAKDTAVLNDADVWKLYTKPEISFSDINGDLETMGGVGIGTILNEQWTFGLAGHISINDIKAQEGSSDFRIDRWNFWYAGAEVGYILSPQSLLHLNPSILGGGGQIEVDNSPFDDHRTASFVIVQPQLALCLNLHETWELGASVGYRWISGADINGLTDEDLSDLTWSVFLRATEF